jgi:hypothetical protein
VYAPLIVGVEHDFEQKTLLNQYCQRQFQSKILPLIDDHTLLLLEGSYEIALHRNDERLYFCNKYRTEKFMGTGMGARFPAIGYRDGRCLKPSALSAGWESICYAVRYIHPHIHLASPAPKTHDELREAFSTAQLKYHVSESWWYRKRCNRRYCRESLEHLMQFDWPMISAAHEWERSGGRAIILCGAIHAFTIHRSTGWPISFLNKDDPATVHAETMDLISFALYPEAILGRTPFRLRPHP